MDTATETKTAHTPMPWTLHHDSFGSVEITSKTQRYVACFGNPRFYTNAEADAAFIVRACNAHDELVEATRWMLALIDGGEAMPKPGDEVAEAMRAALRKATPDAKE